MCSESLTHVDVWVAYLCVDLPFDLFRVLFSFACERCREIEKKMPTPPNTCRRLGERQTQLSSSAVVVADAVLFLYFASQ